MRRPLNISDHCLTDHLRPKAIPPPMVTAKILLATPMYLVDRKTHFTGLRGAGWRIFGVTRSRLNPNVCTVWNFHIEAGRLGEITTLFADCRGFTTMMRERGPEAVRPLVDELFRRCSEIVVNHDGIVDHFLGDAVMAFFNVPIRSEDHIAQAISAAMEIQMAAVGITVPGEDEQTLRVGIGISSGLAITGKLGSDSCEDYTSLGDVVNIAARLQGEAAPGEVLVTEEVYQAVNAAFPNAQERLLDLRGIPEPVNAYCLT